MPTEAEALLTDTGWLPEPLRTSGQRMPPSTDVVGDVVDDIDVADSPDAGVQTAAIAGAPAMDDVAQPGAAAEAEQEAQLTAAE